MFSLWDIFGHECEPIKIIDVGAMMIDNEPPDYHALLKPGAVKIIGFEPDQDECRKLNQTYTGDCLFLPYFIGDGNDRKFNLCRYNMTSSFYEPNVDLLDKFQLLTELIHVVKSATVSTKRLDDIDEVQGADYLKIDVQGAEVDVFNGAKNVLTDTMIVHTEVEFVPLYIDQPLFAEVDQNMRKNGFLLHKFLKLAGHTFKPLIVNDKIDQPLSQILWTDAIYIKNFMHYDRMPPEKLLKLAIILHDVYNSYDIVHYILQHYDKQTSGKCAEQYLHLLTNPHSPPV